MANPLGDDLGLKFSDPSNFSRELESGCMLYVRRRIRMQVLQVFRLGE